MDDPMIVELKNKMVKAIHIIQEDLGTIRTGRATPALVENLTISAYGGTAQMRLKEMATITTEGPRMLIVAPFDPTAMRDVEKGINTANLGYTGAVDGNIIRIVIPPLTEERREEYIKLAHTKIEGGRVMIRQIRHEVMAQLKRSFEAKEVSEDDKKKLEKDIQTLTDEMMAELDNLRERKEKELREV